MSASDGPVLAIAGVTKAYGEKRVLEGVDLTIAAGDVLALLGPNGAGKTTLISIVTGITEADEGSVTVTGIDVARSPRAAARNLAVAPQEIALYLTLDVERNLRFFGELQGLYGSRLRQRITEVSKQLEIEPTMDRRVGSLSGGEQRRVHAAAAILARPRLLLLDEPTAGSDVRSRGHIIDVVRGLAADGTAVCYTTHYINEVEQLEACVAILHEGRIATSGYAHDLIESDAPALVELRFDGDAPKLELDGGVVKSRGECVTIETDEPTRAIAQVFEQLDNGQPPVVSLEVKRPSLERVYLDITEATG